MIKILDSVGRKFNIRSTWFRISALIGCSFGVGINAAPAMAEDIQCTFVQECMGTDGCSETTFGLGVTFGSPSSEIAMDFGTFHGPTLVAGDFTTIHAHVPDSGDSYLLTISFESEPSHFSVHMPSSEVALYYAGTCEAVQ